jgi:hypothetical protein
MNNVQNENCWAADEGIGFGTRIARPVGFRVGGVMLRRYRFDEKALSEV